MLGTVLVFDIETIPDCTAGRRLHGLDTMPDEDVAKVLYAKHCVSHTRTFLPHHLHQIVAISAVLHTHQNLRVWSLGDESSTEKELLQRFFEGIEKYSPSLVSWNGQGFDLPVMHYRALFHGITAARYWETGDQDSAFRWNNYLNRFHYRHLDLMDTLAAYNNRAFAPLHEMATLAGFPGKLGMDGSKVWDAFLQGQLAEIRAYCETDVMNSYLLYLRFELMRGHLSPSDYENYAKRLAQHCETSDQAHFQDFLTAWEPKS